MWIPGWREHTFAQVMLLLVSLAMAAAASGASQVVFDLRTTITAPFPSNRFTVIDQTNLTRLRVNLPKPDCVQRPLECNDIDVLNTLDGFNLQPRLRIPFSGPIDPKTITSSSVFLVRLFDAAVPDLKPPVVIGINQIVWDSATNTLYAESNELLEQHTTYLLVVTNAVRDTAGASLSTAQFTNYISAATSTSVAAASTSSVTSATTADTTDAVATAYRSSVSDGVQRSGVASTRIVAASIFTTLSATAQLEKIRGQIKATVPLPATFMLGTNGVRTVFSQASVRSINVSRQVRTTPSYQVEPMALPLLAVVPNSVGTLAVGRYGSPIYQNSQQYIPNVGTRTGVPVVQRTEHIVFNLVLPAGSKPAAGWPVAIYGSGFGSNKDSIVAFASVLASKGIASIGINLVGHGGGKLGTMTVTRTDGTSVSMPSGGRGIDQNADGVIGISEGVDATVPRSLVGPRDTLRQAAIDLMQLTRLIETGGVDVNGDGASELDGNRIYYFGISYGGMYGPILLAVEPSISAGVPNVGGGSLSEVTRLGVFRSIPAASLTARKLLNLRSTAPPQFGFNENMPLRNEAVRVNTVAGAMAIQEYFDRWEWASMSGDPLGYVRHLRKAPLSGVPAKSVIVQFSRGDRIVPNPTSSAMIRAGGLTDRATYFRTDLAVAANPAVPKDPHTFLGGLGTPATAGFAKASQTQIAVFFASDGVTVMDPDGAGTLFETPVVGALPERTNLLP
jgi:hypothetical protein